MKGFKFKKTAYSNFIFTNILIVILPNFCLSQNVNLEKNGLKFSCNVYISTYKKTDAFTLGHLVECSRLYRAGTSLWITIHDGIKNFGIPGHEVSG